MIRTAGTNPAVEMQLRFEHAALAAAANAISERKAAEEALHASEARYRTLAESAPIGIFGTGVSGEAIFLNARWEAISGRPARESLGYGWLNFIHPEDRIRTAQQWHAAQSAGIDYVSEHRVLRPDGEVRWVAAHGTPIRTEDGRVTGYVGTVEDITERIEAHQALHAAQEQIVQQERLRALGEMASGIAHDLNNALAPVLGFSELLLDVPAHLEDTDLAREYVRLIHTGAQDAAGVVRRLREFYRPREANELLGPVDLAALVTQVVSLTQPKWKDQAQAEGRTVDVTADCAPVPLVPGSEAELREALTNLVFNAVDAMPQGGQLTLRTATGDDYAVLEVSDTGTGMPDDVRRRCLEPFFTTKGTDGSGLGLAMVHGIVRRHRGQLWIESAPGMGTRVRIELPRGTAAGEAGAQMAASEIPPLHLLVVDDDPHVRTVTELLLAADGHTVVTAAGGHEALERCRIDGFDVVITDRAMPGMNGDEFARALKQVAPATPVIMLTGFGDLMLATGSCPAGVDLILSKPASGARLRDALATVTLAENGAGAVVCPDAAEVPAEPLLAERC